MSTSKRVSIYALVFAMNALTLPTTCLAAQCDCSQPVSNGANPSATDCLKILKVAVGLLPCGPPCPDDVCDVDGNASISATDALACLKAAVGTDGLLDCPTTTTTVPVTTTTTTLPVVTTTTTLPTSDWGMDCFAPADCGAFCGGTSCQCDAFLESIGLSPPSAMCFFDCMDLGGTVVGCRATCGGPVSAPACDTTTAGAGGFTGVVTGAGKCEPSGFAVAVVLGGSASEFKRLEITFTEAIDESTLFDAPPPPCDASCPPSCPPTAVVALPDHFRLQMGSATPPPEVCDRGGVAVSACKSGPTSYVIALDAPICSTLPIELSIFMSCHVGNGIGDFLHFTTGDFFAVGTWPP